MPITRDTVDIYLDAGAIEIHAGVNEWHPIRRFGPTEIEDTHLFIPYLMGDIFGCITEYDFKDGALPSSYYRIRQNA